MSRSLTVVGGPGYYPDHESSIYAILKRTPSPVTTLNRDFKMAISRLKKRYNFHQPLQKVRLLAREALFAHFWADQKNIFLIRMANKLVFQFQTCPENLSKNIEK